MSYNYQVERPRIFTEDGMQTFMKIRDEADRLIDIAGAVSSGKLMGAPGITGDTWFMLACMDYLIETKHLIEVTDPAAVWGQHRIFRKPRS